MKGTKIKVIADDARQTVNQLNQVCGSNLPVPVMSSQTRIANDGAILLYTETKEEAHKLKEKLSDKFKVYIEEKNPPRVKVKRVPLFISDEDVAKQLGLGARVITSQEYPSSQTKNVIAVTPTKLYFQLIETKTVSFGNYITCRITPSNIATQCGICLKLGHGTEKCTKRNDGNEAIRCSHCGVSGHRKANCPSSQDTPCCGNCADAKLEVLNHNAFDKQCPLRIKANHRVIRKTDWKVDHDNNNDGPSTSN